MFDDIYGNQKTKTDTKSIPFCRFIQLYSRNSGRHVRIKEDRSVDASGEDGDKYGTDTTILITKFLACLGGSIV